MEGVGRAGRMVGARCGVFPRVIGEGMLSFHPPPPFFCLFVGMRKDEEGINVNNCPPSMV